jgi:DNA-binding transcriptional LysR family regulator
MMEINNIDNQQRTTGMPVIGLRLLRFAVVANDCGSLRQAAELLSIPHSVVSRSIGQLERLVGTSLFERSTAGVQPTLAGKVVVRIARMVLEQVDTLVATGRSIGRGETGHLSVGFCTSISAGNLRTTLLDFRTRFPRIELAIA